MNCIQISKEDGSTYPLYFTDTELNQIHQYVEYRNLETDFINKLHESYYQIDYWLRAEHLEAIPELMPWLIQNFRKYQSADSRYNATLEKVLTHFHNVAITPELFRDLEALCLTAIPGNPRQKIFAAAAEAITLDLQHKCSCSKGPEHWCAACRYLNGQLDIRDFIAGISIPLRESTAGTLKHTTED